MAKRKKSARKSSRSTTRKKQSRKSTRKKTSQSSAKRAAPRPRRSSSASANLVGKVLFLAGVILALLAGLVPNLEQFPWVVWVLAILGLLVGMINISPAEQTQFLVASITLMLVSVGILAFLPDMGNIIPQIFKNLIAFVAPAGLVVALTAILNLARD